MTAPARIAKEEEEDDDDDASRAEGEDAIGGVEGSLPVAVEMDLRSDGVFGDVADF